MLRQFDYDQSLETNLAPLLWSLRLILWLLVTLDPPGGSEVVLPTARASRCNVTLGILVWQNYVKVLDMFVGYKEVSSLEIPYLTQSRPRIPCYGFEEG